MSLVRYLLSAMMGVMNFRRQLLVCVVIEFLWLIIGRAMLVRFFAPFK